MNDQRSLWNQKHRNNQLDFGLQPSLFAQSVQDQIKPGDDVLELGCGRGGDARLFAELGAHVTATDFSEVAITKNQAAQDITKVGFQVVDTSQPLPFANNSFDVVYSHLALHYWDAPTTAAVFAEITRVLRPDGKLYFACKSRRDPKFGKGTKIASGVFELDGHIRHFFSPDYVRELLGDNFVITRLEEVNRTYGDEMSVFVVTWAIKR